MKKLIIIILCLSMLIGMVACDSTEENSSSSDSTAPLDQSNTSTNGTDNVKETDSNKKVDSEDKIIGEEELPMSHTFSTVEEIVLAVYDTETYWEKFSQSDRRYQSLGYNTLKADIADLKNIHSH